MDKEKLIQTIKDCMSRNDFWQMKDDIVRELEGNKKKKGVK